MSITIDDIELPAGWIALSNFGPSFNTTVIENAGGRVDVQENWPRALWGGTIRFLRSHAETVVALRIDEVYRFFLNRHGMGRGFLVLDPTDNADDSLGGSGVIKQVDGTWRLVKIYTDDLGSYERVITRPADDVVLSDGTLGDLGVVTGISEEGTWTGGFYIPMRFTADHMLRDILPDGTEALDLAVTEVVEA